MVCKIFIIFEKKLIFSKKTIKINPNYLEREEKFILKEIKIKYCLILKNLLEE